MRRQNEAIATYARLPLPLNMEAQYRMTVFLMLLLGHEQSTLQVYTA